MTTILPRHVLCVLGNWRDWSDVNAIVRQPAFAGFELDGEFSQLAPDSRMKIAFAASYDRVSPSMTDADWQAVESHRAVAYIVSPPIRQDQAKDISSRGLLLISELLQAGGVAAKGESSGIAHGRDQWLTFAADFTEAREQRDDFTARSNLIWTWVRRPLVDDEVFYTCGMHLLGERDVEIDSALEWPEAVEWMDLLALYLVGDRPMRPVQDGEEFRLHEGGPRRLIRLLPCERYAADDFFFNPFGYVRLEVDE